MQFFRRYASLIAALVFVTSGPLAAWHVAREAVPRSPCAMAAGVATLAAAHGVESVPDGTGCLACHLLQQVRVPVAAVVAGVPASTGLPLEPRGVRPDPARSRGRRPPAGARAASSPGLDSGFLRVAPPRRDVSHGFLFSVRAALPLRPRASRAAAQRARRPGVLFMISRQSARIPVLAACGLLVAASVVLAQGTASYRGRIVNANTKAPVSERRRPG